MTDKSDGGQPRIAVIGVGQMGVAIAGRLVGKGYDVCGYRRSSMEEFVAVGGRPMPSSLAAVADADCVLECLPSVEAFEAVVEGEQSILTGLGPGQTILSLSSYPLPFKQRMARQIDATGATMLDCELSGSPAMIEAGQAVVFAAGAQDAVERSRALVEDFSARMVFLGAFGGATRMKLVANLLVGLHSFAAAEAFAFGGVLGLDPAQMLDALTGSAAHSTMLAQRGGYLVSRKWEPSAGRFEIFDKYVSMIAAEAGRLEARLPLFEAARPFYEQAMAEGRGSQDIGAVLELIEIAGMRERSAA